MLDYPSEFVWQRFLSEYPVLKEKAIEAGVENDPKRGCDLCFAYPLNDGGGVIKNQAEMDFAKYLYCREFEKEKRKQ